MKLEEQFLFKEYAAGEKTCFRQCSLKHMNFSLVFVSNKIEMLSTFSQLLWERWGCYVLCLFFVSLITCFKNGVKAEMALLGLPRMSRWPHHHPLHIAQPALVVAVVRI